MEDLIYLDNNATTPLDPRVLEAMLPYMEDRYANAASTHPFGQSINRAVKQAREIVAELINADPKEIIFTSGATEAINLAIKGLAWHPANLKRHIITVQTEHKALLDTCSYLETIGFEVTYLPVQVDGLIDLQVLSRSVRKDTLLIAIMIGNNETGVIQDIKTITEYAHERGILVMTDATQAVGKIPVDINILGVDLLTLSGHKMHGPKGIGALYIRNSSAKITPLIHGGGHEIGLRSGTLNTPGIVGLGEACAVALRDMPTYQNKVKILRDRLEGRLLQIPGTKINGNLEYRLYNVANVCFPGFDANAFIAKSKGLAVSNGSACSSSIFEPSHVLLAMGLSANDAFGSIRFSLSKYTTETDIESASKLIESELAIKTSHER